MIRLVTPGSPPPEEGAKPELLDIPALLRTLADNIEAGEYGEVLRAAIVLRSADLPPAVFGHGAVEHVAQLYMDLHAGADELMAMRAPGRE